MKLLGWFRRMVPQSPRSEARSVPSIDPASETAIDIFLSYSSIDRERVLRLRRHYEARGFTVFWDQNVPKGSNWNEWIGGNLRRAKCVIVIWTHNSVKSQNVYHEAEIARQNTKIAPVALDTLRADQFPMGFYTVQCADLSSWNGEANSPELKKLDELVQRLVGIAPNVLDRASLGIATSSDWLAESDARVLMQIWRDLPVKYVICESRQALEDVISESEILHVEAPVINGKLVFRGFQVSNRELHEMLEAGNSSVKLVILSSCDSFRIGAALDGTSVKHLVAAKGNLSVRAAREFYCSFYSRLRNGMPASEAAEETIRDMSYFDGGDAFTMINYKT